MSALHGSRRAELFGLFGGHGLDKTAGFMESLGLHPGHVHATLGGSAEVGGLGAIAWGRLAGHGSGAQAQGA